MCAPAGKCQNGCTSITPLARERGVTQKGAPLAACPWMPPPPSTGGGGGVWQRGSKAPPQRGFSISPSLILVLQSGIPNFAEVFEERCRISSAPNFTIPSFARVESPPPPPAGTGRAHCAAPPVPLWVSQVAPQTARPVHPLGGSVVGRRKPQVTRPTDPPNSLSVGLPCPAAGARSTGHKQLPHPRRREDRSPRSSTPPPPPPPYPQPNQRYSAG